jgi:tRNA (cmo5U34)-methyltransferase
MLDLARARFTDGRAGYVCQDLTAPLPDGPWDAVVSALAIHHLADADKRSLFARVHATLRPGGVFINAEQVIGPTPAFTELYGAYHERAARALGATDTEWSDAQERMRHDRCATVEDQLAWLRAAGFADVDCVYRHHLFAVLVARRAPAPA